MRARLRGLGHCVTVWGLPDLKHYNVKGFHPEGEAQRWKGVEAAEDCRFSILEYHAEVGLVIYDRNLPVDIPERSPSISPLGPKAGQPEVRVLAIASLVRLIL